MTERLKRRQKIHQVKQKSLSIVQSELFGHLFAAADLQQQYPPATPSILFDWALISLNSSRPIRDRNPTPRLKVIHTYIY